MKNSKHTPHITAKMLKLGAAGLCLSAGLLSNNARAAVYYWDPQGTTAGNPYTGNMTQTWENKEWSASSAGAATPANFVEGDAACFAVHTGATTPAFTVTMNGTHSVAGVFDGPLTPDPCTVTVQGTGTWLLANGQGFDITSDAGDPGIVNIDVPIADGSYASATTGQIVTEGGGQLSLNGANTYSGGNFGIGIGGTLLGYSGSSWFGIVNFNSSKSFGTGPIALMRGTAASFGALVAENSGITVPNTLDFSQGTSPLYLNVVGSSLSGGGTTFSGPVTLGAVTVNLGSGGTGNLVNLSGGISGTGGLTTFNASTLEISKASSYTGATTVGAGTLLLGAPNAIATSTSIVLGGGTLNPGGNAQAMGGALGMTAASTIDFTAGAAAVSFPNSSAASWTGILNLVNWVYGDLQFGTDPTGLTPAQLNDITFGGADQGLAALDSNGFLILLPEPSTIALGLMGGLGVLFTVRRRTA